MSGSLGGEQGPGPAGGGLVEAGRRLREARVKRGWTLQQVAERIHVAIRYLDAIENGDPAGVPAAVYIRGFVINYVRILGLDEESILRLLEQDGPRPAVFARPTSPTSRAAAREKAKVSISPDWRRNVAIIAGVIVAGVVVGLTIRGISRMFSSGAVNGVPPSPFEGNAAATPGKTPSVRAPEPAVRPDGLKRVVVSVTAVQECWMQAQIDDGKTTDIEMKPGEWRGFAGISRVRLFIGNAAGVAVSGPQGAIDLPTKPGKVVNLLVTRNDVERLKMPVSPVASSTVAR